MTLFSRWNIIVGGSGSDIHPEIVGKNGKRRKREKLKRNILQGTHKEVCKLTAVWTGTLAITACQRWPWTAPIWSYSWQTLEVYSKNRLRVFLFFEAYCLLAWSSCKVSNGATVMINSAKPEGPQWIPAKSVFPQKAQFQLLQPILVGQSCIAGHGFGKAP